MKYLELGEVFKINIDNKMIYLKVESDGSKEYCNSCYFNQKGNNCPKESNCSDLDRDDDTSIIYRQINPIQDIFIIFGEKQIGLVKHCGAYPTEEDAKKKVEELNKNDIDFTHFYKKVQYYPYGIINDIREIKL